MGGGAFAQAAADGEPTLSTPRMSPDEYKNLKATYLARLRAYFPDGTVTCLIEAPEKADYGDIDLLVAFNGQVDQLDLAKSVGAVAFISRSKGSHQSLTIAALKDGSASSQPTVVYRQISTNDAIQEDIPSTGATEVEYAQIDITIVEPSLMDWHLFYSSYGDLTGLLGRIVRNLGFAISDRGFWLRLQELDDSKKVANSGVADKDGLIFLTLDSKQLMAFLGLSVENYETGFTTREQLFEWLFHCRMLHPFSLRLERDNSRQRQKERKREMYSDFFYSWLPAHMNMTMEMETEKQNKMIWDLRQTLRNEAVQSFSKQQQFAHMHIAITRQVLNAAATNLVKPVVERHSKLDGKKITEVIRGFKRHVLVDDAGHPSVVREGHEDAESQLFRLLADNRESFKDPGAVDMFVKIQWEELRVLVRVGKH